MKSLRAMKDTACARAIAAAKAFPNASTAKTSTAALLFIFGIAIADVPRATCQPSSKEIDAVDLAAQISRENVYASSKSSATPRGGVDLQTSRNSQERNSFRQAPDRATLLKRQLRR